MPGLDVTVLLPSEDRRRVEEDDAAHGRVEGGVEEGVAAEAEAGQRVAALHGRLRHPRPDLVLEVHEHGPEQVLLAAEVVVERAPRHARSLDDLLARGRREAALGEQRPGRRQQQAAGGGRPLRLRAAGPLLAVDSHRPPPLGVWGRRPP